MYSADVTSVIYVTWNFTSLVAFVYVNQSINNRLISRKFPTVKSRN